MKRLSILLFALLVGATAPARAWCEATCAAPAEHTVSATSHCSPTESPDSGAALSALAVQECPAIEAARPVPAKLDLDLAMADAVRHPGTRASRPAGTPAPQHLNSHVPSRYSPLRI